MNDVIRTRCELLLCNRDAVAAAFPWSSAMAHLACANAYTMRLLAVEPTLLKQSRQMIRSRLGVFSSFRGPAEDLLAATLDLSGEADALLARAITVFELLKKEVHASSYLPMTAVSIARFARPDEYADITARTAALYRRMREEHPFLTSAEDTSFCAMLTLSGQSEDLLIARMERCYDWLKPRFSGNALQTLSHVLALVPGTVEDLCLRVEDLADAFKAARNKWGTTHELPVLGILAGDTRPVEQLVSETIECSDWLKTKKGFGFFSTISRTQRLMFAALMTQRSGSAAESAGMTSVLTAMIAQEVAMSAIAASAAASAST